MSAQLDGHAELLAGFVEESTGALRALPSQLGDYQQRPQRAEPLHAVFRVVHSIKGNAGFFGWGDVRDFAHALEGCLEELRDDRIELGDDLRLALVRGFDRLETLLQDAAAGRSTAELSEPRQRELRQLATLARKGRPGLKEETVSWQDASDLAFDIAALDVPAAGDLAQRVLWLAGEKRVRPLAEVGPEVSQEVKSEAAALDGAPGATSARWLRVRDERLDEFLEWTTQLFDASAALRELAARVGDDPSQAVLAEELNGLAGGLQRRAAALQDGLVSLRKTSLAALVGKYPRVARDLAARLGKQLEAIVCGAQTEIDKTIVDDLDVVVGHLVRNAVDHGLEFPTDRVAASKPIVGTLVIRGERTRDTLRIAVEDDGRGIDPQRLRAKAAEQGRRSPREAEELTDDEALDLIFQPGFSTARDVTEISGRGVGLDAVRALAKKHGGQVTATSTVGQGTRFVVELPVRQRVAEFDLTSLRAVGD